MQPQERSFFRRHPVATVAGLGVLALMTWVGYEIVRAVTAKPGKAGQFNAQIQAAVEEKQAALPGPDVFQDFLQAVERFRATELNTLAEVGTKVSGSRLPDPPADWPSDFSWPPDASVVGTDASHPAIEALFRKVVDELKSNGSIQALEALVPPHKAVRPLPPGRLIDILLPELGSARATARLNHARMMFAVADGDSAETAAAFEHTLTLARICGAQSTLIDHLVAVAMCSLAMQDARYLIAEGKCNRQMLEGFRTALDRQLPLPDMTVTFDSERLFVSDALMWTHSEDGRVMPSAMNGIMSQDGNAHFPTLGGLENTISVFLPSREESQAMVDEFYTLIKQDAAVPAHQRTRPAAAETFAENLSRRFLIVKMMLPAFSKALVSKSAQLNDVQALRTMIALELFRLEKGAYPAALDELVPTYLSRKPADEFSASGMRYVLKDAKASPPADAYLFYSPGQDLVDDNGAPSKRGTTGDNGKDVVYSTRRPSSKNSGN